jgi:hypothetical protein
MMAASTAAPSQDAAAQQEERSMPTTIHVRVQDEVLQLLQRYQAHTGTAPADYVAALLEQTRPTLQAVVEAFDEAGGDAAEMARLFGSKMADIMRAREREEAATQP